MNIAHPIMIALAFVSLTSCLTMQPYDYDKAQREYCEKNLKPIKEGTIDRVSIEYEKRYAPNDKRFQYDNDVEIKKEWEIKGQDAQCILDIMRHKLRLPQSYVLTVCNLYDPDAPTYFLALNFYQGETRVASILPLDISPEAQSTYQLDANEQKILDNIIKKELKSQKLSSPYQD